MHEHVPYRGTPETPSTDATPRRSRPRRRFVAALGLVAACAAVVARRDTTPSPGVDAVPDALRNGPAGLLLGGEPLPIATPLAPLIASDQPAQLGVMEPGESAMRYDRGDSVMVRFNRPMVVASQVGRVVEAPPLTFVPPLRGVARWVSRSSLQFTPEEATWARTQECSLRIAAGLRALSGETLEGDVQRVVVFDGSPRLVAPDTVPRVAVGSPLRVRFEGQVDVRALGSQIFAYELGGGLRPLVVRTRAAGADASGRRLVDLLLDRSLEPGARVGIAYAPGLRADRSEGEEMPGTLSFEFAPPPRLEGVNCAEDAESAEGCAYGPRPGRVVDVRQTLRILASEPIAEASAAGVLMVPPLPGMRVTASGRLLTLEGQWAPDQVYELRLGALRSVEGAVLRDVSPLAVRSVGLPPAVRVATGRLTWERASDGRLPFATVNAGSGVLRFTALDEATLVSALLSRLRPGDGARMASLHAAAPSERPNRWGQGHVAWTQGAGGDAALLEMDPDGPGGAPASTVLAQRTDLGVSAQSLTDGVMAWVTSLRAATPTAGVRVAVYDELGALAGSAQTDADGVAWIPLGGTVLRGPMALVASTADDRAGMVADRRRGEGPGSFSVPLDAVRRADDAPVAAVVLDRGAVRPGERVRAKIIARLARDGALHAFGRQRVRVSLRGPSGEISSEEVRLSNGGTGDAEFSVPRNASTGDYAVAVIRGSEAPMGESAFQVAEFRTPNARVDLNLARTDLTEGDEVLATTNARYLFGAPISSAPVRWTLRRLGEAERPQRWRPFTFSPVDVSVRPGTVDSGEAVLERDGTVRVRTAVRHSAPVRERVSLEVTVRDPSGQETSARQTFETFPATHEVGLRTLDAWIAHGHAIDIDALVIGHDGNPAPGVRAEVKVYREGWHSYYQWARGGEAEGDGAWRARRDRQREQVHRFEVTSTGDVVHTPWTPPQPGTYVIEATLTDAAGHHSVASQRVYAAGPTEHPDRDPPGAPFALTPTRVEWTVGERAALSFECPWPEAEALVTVVQSGVIHRERRRVQSGSVSLALPVTAAMIPNAFVTVTLVRPRTGAPLATGALDLGSPDVRWGATELRVRPPTEALQVAVQAPAESAPGSDVPVSVRVQNGAGEGVSTEVLLYAVDEGVLRLTRYDTPDPSAALLPRRAPSFSLEDLRRTVISRLNLPALPGASGDGGESFADDSVRDVRDDYDPTPLWMPRLHTDAQGQVSATLHLPGRAGQYRVMALAVGDGLRNGRAATVITARRDVAVRALLPRSLTAGDRFEAAALLNNTTHEARRATLVMRVDGEVRSTQEVNLAADAEVRVAETLDARGARMDVSFEVTQGTDRATDHRVIPVAPASYASRRSIVGAHERAATLTLTRGQNTVEPAAVLTVSSRPFLGLDAAAEVLDEGGDTGVVNLAARVISWAALARADRGRSAQWSGEEARQRGERALAALLQRQREDGGFGHWGAESEPVPQITALAMRAFVAAGRQGWAVDAGASRRTLTSITEWLRSQEVSRYSANDIAHALRVLHDVGADQPTLVTRLFDQREVLGAWGCAELAMAMMPDDPRRATLLFAAGRLVGASSAQTVARPTFFDTQPRTLAAVLEAATRAERLDLARDAAQHLLAMRSTEAGVTWGDAVSTSFCVDALSRYADLFGEGRPLRVTVTLDGAEVLPTRATDDVARYVFDPARLGAGDHPVRVQGAEGTFFTALDGRWRTPYGEAEQMARGRTVALHRMVEGEAGRTLHEGDSVRLGELLRVRLWVYAEARTAPYVIVRNAHGGGFEAVDQGFDTTPQSSLEAMLGMGLDDAASDPRVYHAARSLGDISARRYFGGETVFQMDYGLSGLREYTYGVRATTAGRFLLPPAELRTLYSESTVARSASMTLTVTR